MHENLNTPRGLVNLVAWCLVAAGVFAGGCSFDVPDDQVVNLCVEDSQCPTGACIEARCVSPTIVSAEVVLQVIPTAMSDVRPSFTTESFEITGPSVREIPVPGWVEVRGNVRFGEERVGAELTFSRQGLPGTPEVVITTATLNEPSIGEDGTEADYVVRLEAGKVYNVTVRPDSTLNGLGEPWFRTLPPLRFVGLLETPASIDGVQNTVWRAMFPYDGALSARCEAGRTAGCTLSGSVVRMVGPDLQPEAGLQVRAVDTIGRVVSSVALTDADGAFEIVVSPSAEGYVLRVGGGSEREVFPIIDADPARLAADLRIRVPEAIPVRYEGSVETASGARSSATIAFFSDDVVDEVAGLRGSFRTSTVAENGSFEVDLLPGTYEVTVTPSNLDLAVATESVRIAATAGGVLRGQVFTVSRRARLGGSVEVPGQREMAGAMVEARAFEDGTRNRSSAAVSDETGRFALPLDIGSYDLFLRPPAQSGYAWVVVPDLVVGAVDTTLVAHYLVEPPVPLAGRVVGANAEGLAGVEIRAFVRTADRFIEVARSRAESDGSYEVLIPARFMSP